MYRNKARAALVMTLFATAAVAQSPATNPTREIHFTDAAQERPRFQEMLTLLRQVAGVTADHNRGDLGNVAIAGSASQLAAADWLGKELDRPTAVQTLPATVLHRFPEADGRAVDVFYLAHATTSLNIQELVTVLRQVVDLNNIYWYTRQNAIALEGAADRVAIAEWLVPRLDRSVSGMTPGQQIPHRDSARFVLPGHPDDVTEILYFEKMPEAAGVQDLTRNLRTQASIMHMFAPYGEGALVFRGTTERVSLVEELVAAQTAVVVAHNAR